jgi:hypothetical protein
VSACAPASGPSSDRDADGLEDHVEWGLGSDPDDADSDDDGLLDGEEIDLGTLWLDPDSDDDGYSDRDEDFEGTDPLDAASVIYRGGWPYYFEKTELKGGKKFEVGNRFANFTFVDQFGDVVELWDFYNEDRYVVVDICVEWYGRICENLSRWVAGERGAIYEEWVVAAEAVDAGALHWITILLEDENFEPVDEQDVVDWAEDHSHDRVPTLGDPDQVSAEFTELRAFPYLALLSPDLKVHTIPTDGWDYTTVLDAAVNVVSADTPVE